MRNSRWTLLLSTVAILALAGCGDDGGSSGGDGGVAVDGDGTPIGNDPGDGTSDGVAGCTETGPQCDNCVDDDGDSFVDGLDPECSGPQDNDEGSFATGIDGDNIDGVFQDCFFDGDSGEGNDGCQRPTCCLTEGASDTCPPTPAGSCEPSQKCIDSCEPLTPPGCDCFGCCTICNEDTCVDVATGLATDNCNSDTLTDENECPTCVKTDTCGSNCESDPCVLCPGETEVPDTCEGGQSCPEGQELCGDGGTCADGFYCSGGCCVAEYIIE